MVWNEDEKGMVVSLGMRRKEFVLFISDFFINTELILMAIDLAGQRCKSNIDDPWIFRISEKNTAKR